MGKNYEQLTLNERIEIYRLHKNGLSLRKISALQGRSASTISREIKRNSKPTKQWRGPYDPVRAHKLAMRRRRWDCRFKLARQPALQQLVRNQLVMGWSPEQISGWLARQYGATVVSHESIYRFIYHRTAQKDNWHKLLPRARFRRGRHSKRVDYALNHLKQRRSVHERPAWVQQRKQAGHWEADLMLFARYGDAVVISHERKSRLVMAARQGKSATETKANLSDMLSALPPRLRRTMTFDNGTEFASHHLLGKEMAMQTYFCDVRAPWQKGGVENAIGRLRRFLPRKTDLKQLDADMLDDIIACYNNTPRKCLDYQTPAEVFSKQLQLLHFKRESTFPHARE